MRRQDHQDTWQRVLHAPIYAAWLEWIESFPEVCKACYREPDECKCPGPGYAKFRQRGYAQEKRAAHIEAHNRYARDVLYPAAVKHALERKDTPFDAVAWSEVFMSEVDVCAENLEKAMDAVRQKASDVHGLKIVLPVENREKVADEIWKLSRGLGWTHIDGARGDLTLIRNIRLLLDMLEAHIKYDDAKAVTLGRKEKEA